MLISVFSPKGGVGKTTVALALAHALAEKSKVCAVEFDFSPGDFATVLKLPADRAIVKAVEDADGAVKRPSGENFDAIVGGYPDDIRYISPDKLKNLLEKLKQKYDTVIVDMQPGFVENCIDIMEVSDRVVVIIEDDLRIAARVNGFMDWMSVNRITDYDNFVFLRNMARKRLMFYFDKIRYRLPILYSIPFIRRLKGYGDRRLQRHVKKIVKEMKDYVPYKPY